MHTVAARAVGHGLGTGLAGQAAVGSVKADHAVGWQPEGAAQPHVSVATPAGIADVGRVYHGGGVLRLEDLVFAVAIVADGRLGDTPGEGLAMHAGAVLIDDFAVAHAAGVGDGGAKRLRLGVQQLVGAAVAHSAIGRAFVPVLAGLAVDAEGVVAGLLLMAGDALRFGDVGGVRKLVVGFVTSIARQPGVGAFFELLGLIVARRALCNGPLRRIGIGAGQDERGAE